MTVIEEFKCVFRTDVTSNAPKVREEYDGRYFHARMHVSNNATTNHKSITIVIPFLRTCPFIRSRDLSKTKLETYFTFFHGFYPKFDEEILIADMNLH